MAKTGSRGVPALRFLFEYSIFLILGSATALLWANVDNELGTRTYHRLIKFRLSRLFEDGEDAAQTSPVHSREAHSSAKAIPEESTEPGRQPPNAAGQAASAQSDDVTPPHNGHEVHAHPITVEFFVNDVLMALFFAIAAKEVFEAMLPGGALSNPRTAATPLIATLGGIVGPAVLYLTGAALISKSDTLGGGWAIPCATDIAFSYLVARVIFGVGHPAIAFLLLLAIADDAAGLVILAVFYPSGELALQWLLLTVAAVGLGIVLQRLKLTSFWWYLLIPGVLSWYSFFKAGIHPALGLVPIIPTMPHAHSDLGIFAREELNRRDTLNEFEHWWKNPVELILGLFGLVNAGVVMSNVGPGTWLVLVGLLAGKPLGISLFALLGEKLFRFQIPAGMTHRHVISLGMIAGIGFTVALFVSTAAFPEPGPVQDSVKMGALASFLAAILAYIGSRMLGIRPLKGSEHPEPALDADAAV